MADQLMNVDAYVPAAVTAASKWFEAGFAGEEDLASVDGYVPAAVTAASRWFEGVVVVEDRGGLVDSYTPAAVTAASKWIGAVAVGQRDANYWTVVPTQWQVTVYKMRGMDALLNSVYDTWLVEGAPDDDASEYAGTLATPLRDVVVIDTWVKS